MARQKSQPTSRKPHGSTAITGDIGTLFIVGVPIGSPDDLTIRARTILGQVSIVAAETPLATQDLLAHHGITAKLTSYGPFPSEGKIAVLIERLKAGHNVALVSDSGMPVIYDPGRSLIAAAQQSGCPVTIVPGPSALTAAAALSGYSGDRIVFNGKLPRTQRLLEKSFATLKHESGTTVMFASPRTLSAVLNSLARTVPDSQVTIVVNMTKPGETLLQGDARTLLEHVSSLPREAEVTVVVSGSQRNTTIKKRKRTKNA